MGFIRVGSKTKGCRPSAFLISVLTIVVTVAVVGGLIWAFAV